MAGKIRCILKTKRSRDKCYATNVPKMTSLLSPKMLTSYDGKITSSLVFRWMGANKLLVTKGRLLTLLAILIIVEITLRVMSVNDFIISDGVHSLIIFILLFPAMLFINYKLFLVVRKSRKNKRISREMKTTFSLKNISSCLLAAACVVVISIPACVCIGLRINSPETRYTLDNANLAGFWAITIALMNCTFNCLIFYWKNKVLRTEGLKILKNLKICRRVES